MPFRIFEHTADVGIEVEAPTLEALFADAARGLFAVIRGDNEVTAERAETVSVEAEHLHHLLLEFLESFVFLQDAEGLVFRDVDDVRVEATGDGWRATANVQAEPFSHERHPGCVHVKAVTRHELAVTEPQGDRPGKARIILDI